MSLYSEIERHWILKNQHLFKEQVQELLYYPYKILMHFSWYRTILYDYSIFITSYKLPKPLWNVRNKCGQFLSRYSDSYVTTSSPDTKTFGKFRRIENQVSRQSSSAFLQLHNWQYIRGLMTRMTMVNL